MLWKQKHSVFLWDIQLNIHVRVYRSVEKHVSQRNSTDVVAEKHLHRLLVYHIIFGIERDCAFCKIIQRVIELSLYHVQYNSEWLYRKLKVNNFCIFFRFWSLNTARQHCLKKKKKRSTSAFEQSSAASVWRADHFRRSKRTCKQHQGTVLVLTAWWRRGIGRWRPKVIFSPI